MANEIKNPLLPSRREIALFWIMIFGVFLGWTSFCLITGYLMAGA